MNEVSSSESRRSKQSFAFIAEIIADQELSPARKEAILDQLLTEAAHERYDGWNDWRLNLLGKCSELADNRHLRAKLENHLMAMVENEQGDSWSVKYFAEQINLLRYHMIEKYDGRKKAEEFIKQNLQYSDFRKMAIESAMKQKDYHGVVKLALDRHWRLNRGFSANMQIGPPSGMSCQESDCCSWRFTLGK